jgi:hypothetical protein
MQNYAIIHEPPNVLEILILFQKPFGRKKQFRAQTARGGGCALIDCY